MQITVIKIQASNCGQGCSMLLFSHLNFINNSLHVDVTFPEQ